MDTAQNSNRQLLERVVYGGSPYKLTWSLARHLSPVLFVLYNIFLEKKNEITDMREFNHL